MSHQLSSRPLISKDDYETLSASDKLKARQKLLKSSLYEFCHFLGYKDVNPRTHGETIYCLEARSQRKLITVPRGCFKSSIAAITYPIWRLIKNPDLRILIDSEKYLNAVTYLRAVKAHFKDETFINVFGDLEGPLWQDGAITINGRTKKLKEASITCGGVATTKVGQHYDIIIGDDYNSRENTRTPELAQGPIDHFKYNLNILEPDGEYVIIGTRYSDSDVIGFILRDVLGKTKLAEGKLDEWE